MYRLRPSPGCDVGVVVGLRGVPVRDQQTLLVRVVVHPVRLGVRVAEVVRAGLEVLVVRDVRPVARDVVVVVQPGARSPRRPENPSSVQPVAGLGAVGEERRAVGGDGDVVTEEATLGDAAVGTVVEPELHHLARVRVQRDVDVDPRAVAAAVEGRACRCRRRRTAAPSTVPSSAVQVCAAVGRRLEVEVVVVLPRCRTGALSDSAAEDLPVRSNVRGHRVVEVVVVAGEELLGRRRTARRRSDGDLLLRQHHHGGLRLGGVVLLRAEVQRSSSARPRPPRSRASRAGACSTRRGRRPRCRCPASFLAPSRLCAIRVQYSLLLSPPPVVS